MPSNIEIKARVLDLPRITALAEKLSDAPAVIIQQHDTFFLSPNGRLKLRQFSPEAGELIFYSRADVAGTKQSDYLIARTTAPAELLAVLCAALGAQQTVIKTRRLFLVGQTRVHLDAVEGLGSFVELEVVLREGQPPEEGHRIARELMLALDIRESDLIEGAYADLLHPGAIERRKPRRIGLIKSLERLCEKS
ncbi:MAG: adenylate cyclase, partial [Chthoniobacterales bacterium]